MSTAETGSKPTWRSSNVTVSVSAVERRNAPRTSERAANGHLAAAPARFRQADDAFGNVDRLVAALALVAHSEAVGGDAHRAEFVERGRERALGAAFVEHQPDVHDIRTPWQSLEDFLGIRHLRDFLRIDEAGDFNPAQPRGHGTIDELDLGCRAERGGFVLQAVAGTNLNDLNALHWRATRSTIAGTTRIGPIIYAGRYP